MFRWAASEQLVPAEVANALLTVDAIQPGREGARANAEVMPVDARVVEQTNGSAPSPRRSCPCTARRFTTPSEGSTAGARPPRPTTKPSGIRGAMVEVFRKDGGWRAEVRGTSFYAVAPDRDRVVAAARLHIETLALVPAGEGA